MNQPKSQQRPARQPVALKPFAQVLAELAPLEMIIMNPDDAEFYQGVKLTIEMGEGAQVQTLDILKRLNRILSEALVRQY